LDQGHCDSRLHPLSCLTNLKVFYIRLMQDMRHTPFQKLLFPPTIFINNFLTPTLLESFYKDLIVPIAAFAAYLLW